MDRSPGQAGPGRGRRRAARPRLAAGGPGRRRRKRRLWAQRKRAVPSGSWPGFERAALGRRGASPGRCRSSLGSGRPAWPRPFRQAGRRLRLRHDLRRPAYPDRRAGARLRAPDHGRAILGRQRDAGLRRPLPGSDERHRPGRRRVDGPARRFPDVGHLLGSARPAAADRHCRCLRWRATSDRPMPTGPRRASRARSATSRSGPDRTIAPWLSRDHHKAILEAMWGQRTADSLAVAACSRSHRPGRRRRERLDEGQAGRRRRRARGNGRRAGSRLESSWFTGDHDIHAQHPAELAEAILAADREGLFSGAVPA